MQLVRVVCGIMHMMASLKNEWIDKCICQLPLCSFFGLCALKGLWKPNECACTFRSGMCIHDMGLKSRPSFLHLTLPGSVKV